MKAHLIVLTFVAFVLSASAQNPADMDSTFNTEGWFGMAGSVKKIAHRADGKIIIAGTINFYKGIPVNHIFCLNPDGTLDPSFNPGMTFSSGVSTFEIQSDGKIIAAGSANGSRVLKRLNADGSTDSSFSFSGSANGSVPKCMAIQSDGKVLFGGNFGLYPLFRLNANGTTDSSFDQNQMLVTVNSIYVQPTGKIIVAGDSFASLGSYCVQRLNANGTVDSSFTGVINGQATTLSVQSDGKIIVGGDFLFVSTLEGCNVVRIAPDGSIDNSFAPGIVTADQEIYTTLVRQDGKIMIGGRFSSYNQIAAHNIISLNADGTHDSVFDSGEGFNYTVMTLENQDLNTVFLGGDFTRYKSQSGDSIALLDTTGGQVQGFGVGRVVDTQFSLSEFCVQTDGKIIVGGRFNHYNNVITNALVRLNPDGTTDLSFSSGSGFLLGTGYNTSVNAIAEQADGKILVGGYFDSYNGQPALTLIRLMEDGSRDGTFNFNLNLYNWVSKILIQPDGKILVSGLSGGSYRLIRLNVDGTLDATFSNNAVFNYATMAMVLEPNGKIIVGGSFTTFNTSAAPGIVRLNTDGSIDATLNVGSGFSSINNVRTIVLQPDGKIIVGGLLRDYNGVTMLKNLLRLEVNGALDTTFNIGTGFNNTVSSVTCDSEGRLFVGGFFTSFNGNSANRIVGLSTDGALDTDFDMGSGFNAVVTKLAVQPNQSIMVIGGFSSYSQTIAKQIVRLNGNGILGTLTQTLENKLECFPNPAKQWLQVKASGWDRPRSYRIFDFSGKEINVDMDSNNKIDVSGFTNGVYLLQVNTTQGPLTTKFIKS